MTSRDRKGDSFTDRLFNWLYTVAAMNVSYHSTIKPKIYKAYYNGKPVLIKGYRRSRVLTQQIRFFNSWYDAEEMAAIPVPFPDGSYTKNNFGWEWGIFKWIEGRHADFKLEEDRHKTYSIMRQFHRSTQGISMVSIPRDPLYIKWGHRLKQFEDTKDVFMTHRKKTLYDEIHITMTKQLARFTDHPWGELEERSWRKHLWLHGDVAHHNFIIDAHYNIKIIDFDLLYNGPKIYDDIQLAQRFLPHMEACKSDFLKLFKKVEYPRLWLQGVLVPADLLREWLYGYRKCLEEGTSVSAHINKLDHAWQRRKKFVRYTEYMLK